MLHERISNILIWAELVYLELVIGNRVLHQQVTNFNESHYPKTAAHRDSSRRAGVCLHSNSGLDTHASHRALSSGAVSGPSIP